MNAKRPAPNASRILVVDDEKEMCELVEQALEPYGYAVSSCLSGEAAMELLGKSEFDVLLSDNQMQAMTGVELCQAAMQLRPSLRVIIFTGFGNMEVAVEALRAGAHDFITKPVSLEVLVLTIQRAVRHQELRRKLGTLQGEEAVARCGIVGSSAGMKRVLDVVDRVARSDTTVLVRGETGTGKELVARALHTESKRTGPFVAINCSAMPEGLLESELFGHLQGAFTDARTARSGLFVEASGGTLFLDEIGEMPLRMQAKLLRALQERKVRPIGGSRDIPFDARLVAATHRDLEAEVAAKRFREDLYYRINVVTVEVPPLRDRMEEVLPLAYYFLKRASQRSGKPVSGLSQPVAERLTAHHWPGNVRELENCIERAVAMARFAEITVADLPSILQREPASRETFIDEIEAGMPAMEIIEERYFRKVLEAMRGDESAAAKVLGVDVLTLQRRLAPPATADDASAS